jgi:hypothetical protein
MLQQTSGERLRRPSLESASSARHRTSQTAQKRETGRITRAIATAGATFLLQNVGATTYTMCRGVLAFRVSELVVKSIQPCVHGEPLALRLAAKKTP